MARGTGTRGGRGRGLGPLRPIPTFPAEDEDTFSGPGQPIQVVTSEYDYKDDFVVSSGGYGLDNALEEGYY
jgi:hypothetical protein